MSAFLFEQISSKTTATWRTYYDSNRVIWCLFRDSVRSVGCLVETRRQRQQFNVPNNVFSHFPVHQCRLWLELWYHTDSSKNNSGKRLSRKISNCPKIQNKMEFHAVCYYFTNLARKCPNKKDYIYKMDVSLSILPYWSFLWRLKFMSSLTKMFYIFKTSSWNKETLSNYTA